jgi:hypothetical protein
MKRLLTLLTIICLLSSCAASKSYLERNDEDKALQDAVKKLGKSSDDEKAIEAIPELYKTITAERLARIKSLQGSREISRWDKIIKEYSALEEVYHTIIESPQAFKLVTPKSYATEIAESKQSAAEEYYQAGNTLMNKAGRDNAKKAYSNFKKADKFQPGFKDVSLKLKDAYESAIVNVVINPVQDNSFFFNSGWGNAGYNYSNEYFQQTLVRDLSYNSERYAARFFTDWEARRENINPDWVVDLRLRNIDIPQPMRSTYRRNASAQIEIGRDTAGRPVYRTVYATVNINRMSFEARADMEVSIKEIVTGKNIMNNTYRDDYRWMQETATYSGDSRALSSADWQMINNSGYNTPTRDEVLNELYRKIYPQVQNNIGYAVQW